MKPEEIKKLNFEQAIENLQEVVDQIEDGQTPLDQSLDQYHSGMLLIQHCRRLLQDAEKKIEKIATEKEPKSSRKESEKS